MVLKQASSRALTVSDDFKGSHYPKSVILYAVFFYVRYGVRQHKGTKSTTEFLALI